MTPTEPRSLSVLTSIVRRQQGCPEVSPDMGAADGTFPIFQRVDGACPGTDRKLKVKIDA